MSQSDLLDRLVHEGDALLKAGRYAEGEARAREVLARAPKNAGAHYILAMDRDHLRQLRAMMPPDAKARLGMFLDASARWKGEDVPDPYYGGTEGFEQVLDMVEEASGRWLDIIEAELDPERFQLRNPR